MGRDERSHQSGRCQFGGNDVIADHRRSRQIVDRDGDATIRRLREQSGPKKAQSDDARAETVDQAAILAQ